VDALSVPQSPFDQEIVLHGSRMSAMSSLRFNFTECHLFWLRRAFIHAMRLLLTSVGYKSNQGGKSCQRLVIGTDALSGIDHCPTGSPRGPIFSAFFPGIWREKKPRSAMRAPIQWTQCLTATNRRPNSLGLPKPVCARVQYRPSNRLLIVKAALRLGDDPAFLFELRLVDLAAREALL
jgi:hypothetical protein